MNKKIFKRLTIMMEVLENLNKINKELQDYISCNW